MTSATMALAGMASSMRPRDARGQVLPQLRHQAELDAGPGPKSGTAAGEKGVLPATGTCGAVIDGLAPGSRLTGLAAPYVIVPSPLTHAICVNG